MPLICTNHRCATPCWMRQVLLAAAFYHLLFAIWTNLRPHQWFDWIGQAHPNHPLLWQGVGMIVGVFGLALLLAARNPVRNWQIILLGLLKFSLGIVGFSLAVFRHEIPAH